MNNRRTSLVMFLLALLVALVLMARPAFAQTSSDTSKTTITKAQKGATDVDKKIKDKSPDNDPKKVVPAPESKGGTTRGTGPWPCRVHVDNHTGWKIQVYVDGYYDGLLAPWGDGYVHTGNGITTFLGVASFTDGSRITWGEWVFNCPAEGTFTWRLTP